MVCQVELNGVCPKCFCEDGVQQFSCRVDVTRGVPDDVKFNQVTKEGTVNGVKLSESNFDWIVCFVCRKLHSSFFVSQTPFEIVDVGEESTSITIEKPRLEPSHSSYSDGDDEDDDEDDEDDDVSPMGSLKKILRDLEIKVDTHWNCYCKTERVCSCECGCDELRSRR